MGLEIYFDESHKLDKYSSRYSYYGAIGGDYTAIQKFNKTMEESELFQEMHFNKFNLDKVDIYLKALQYALDKFYCNCYIVDSDEAFLIGDRIGIKNKAELRRLFYIKIPERLIYGITRRIRNFNDVDIYIDKSQEYEKFQLTKKLKEQLNAQSIYRGLHYSVKHVRQIDSKESRMIQITDVVLGMIVFLFEKRYVYPKEILNGEEMEYILSSLIDKGQCNLIKSSYTFKKNKNDNIEYFLNLNVDQNEKILKIGQIFKSLNIYSNKSIEKSEAIYRLLMDYNNLNRFCNINLFIWNGEENSEEEDICSDLRNNDYKEIKKESISKYIVEFFQFKTEFDNRNKVKILSLFNKNGCSKIEEKEYTTYLGYGSSLKLLVRRYLSELDIHTK